MPSLPRYTQTTTTTFSLRQEENLQTLTAAMLDQTNQTANLNDAPSNRGNEKFQNHFEDSLCDPLALLDDVFKDPVDMALVSVGSPRSKALEEAVDVPLLMGKSITFEKADESHLPLSCKQ